MKALTKRERGNETQFTTKIGGKKAGLGPSSFPVMHLMLVWVPVTSFCKIFIPSYAFDAGLGPSYFVFVKKFIPSYAFDAGLGPSYFVFVKFSFPVMHLMLVWVPVTSFL